MRGRYRKTWQQIGEQDWPGVVFCLSEGPSCRKHWSAYIHTIGRVDQMGVIHWSGARRRSTLRGLRAFLKFVALAKNRPYRNEPEWQSIYHQNVWATKAARTVYHYMIRRESSAKDRARAWALAMRARIRPSDHHSFYMWIWSHEYR